MALAQQLRRRWHAARLQEGALKAFYRQPFADPGTEPGQLKLLSVDLETTGLDARNDQILSIGWVRVEGEQILLGSGEHHLIRPDSELNAASVVIHTITDDMAARGESLCAVMDKLLAALSGHVLLAHNARIEQAFIEQACRRCYGGPFFIPTIDTLRLALRRLRRRDQAPRSGELRLAALREQYGLPRYKAHNALSDALATAELFLAQSAYWAGKTQTQPQQRLG